MKKRNTLLTTCMMMAWASLVGTALAAGSASEHLQKDSSPVGDMAGILVFVSLAISVLALAISAITLSRIHSQPGKSESRRVHKGAASDSQNRLEDVIEELNLLKREVHSIKGSWEKPPASSVPSMNSRPFQGNAPQSSKPRFSTIEDEYRDFLDSYNKIQASPSSDGMKKKRMREKLAAQFSIHGFVCSNSPQRMNNASIPPAFSAETNLARAEYWAFPLSDGKLAVVPNPKITYEDRIHRAAGMKESFHSNYQHGKIYQHLIVVKPAIFTHSLTLSVPGELQLED